MSAVLVFESVWFASSVQSANTKRLNLESQISIKEREIKREVVEKQKLGRELQEAIDRLDDETKEKDKLQKKTDELSKEIEELNDSIFLSQTHKKHEQEYNEEVVNEEPQVAQATQAQPVSTPVAQSTPSGRKLTMQATAYDGVSLGGITATGNRINSTGDKVIAVDPSVIPLGSRVYVEGYGEAVAWDTGGAINGNIIDLNMGTSEAINWGRRNVEVTILD